MNRSIPHRDEELPVVALLEPIHAAGLDILRSHTELIELAGPCDVRLSEALLTCEGLIVRSTPIAADLLARAPKLRVLGRHGAGTDNIDLDYAARRGIRVVNTPRSNTNSVAEYVIAVIAMRLKRIPEAEHVLRSGAFRRDLGSLPGQVQRAQLIGREISGSRLGVVGAGAIGRAVAGKARALGMHVRAFDPFLPDDVFVQHGIERVVDLRALASESDVLSIHIPGGTGPVITADIIASMPDQSVIVNAARGGVVDEVAMLEALHRGKLGGAAVDVFRQEPPAIDDPIFRAHNLTATPHMAAMTEEALKRMAVDIAEAMLEALGGLRAST